MKKYSYKFIIKVIAIIIAILILSIVPLLLYGNTGILVVNVAGGGMKIAGYAGYYVLPNIGYGLLGYGFSWPQFSLIGLFFGIATTPIFFLSAKFLSYKKYLVWLLVCFFSFNLALATKFLMIPYIGIFISSTILFMIYGRILSIEFKPRDKYVYGLLGCVVFFLGYLVSVRVRSPAEILGVLAYVLGSPERLLLGPILFTGTWGGSPMIKMYAIILWHLLMSLVLLYYTQKKGQYGQCDRSGDAGCSR